MGLSLLDRAHATEEKGRPEEKWLRDPDERRREDAQLLAVLPYQERGFVFV